MEIHSSFGGRWYSRLRMRSLRYLPLVFVVGIDGFAMFAPYVATVLAVAYVCRRMRNQPQPIPITA